MKYWDREALSAIEHEKSKVKVKNARGLAQCQKAACGSCGFCTSSLLNPVPHNAILNAVPHNEILYPVPHYRTDHPVHYNVFRLGSGGTRQHLTYSRFEWMQLHKNVSNPVPHNAILHPVPYHFEPRASQCHFENL
jgi:hypothetical protein